MLRMGRMLAAVLLASPACGSAPPPAPVAMHSEKQGPVDVELLWRGAPTLNDFARKTLYTWTTASQVDGLQHGAVLLSREESPQFGQSYFEQYIRDLAQTDAIAQIVDTTTFARSRFAWTSPWATRFGFGGETYGDQLIRVTLRDEAIMLKVTDNGAPVTAVDLKGAAVEASEVTAHPERIGAVFFVTDTYREYVLPNEAMIESWAIGTRDVTERIAGEAAALDELARRVKAAPGDMDVVAPLYSALAFAGAQFATTPERLAQMAKELRDSTARATIEGAGMKVFAGLGPRRPAPKTPRHTKPRKPVRGTY